MNFRPEQQTCYTSSQVSLYVPGFVARIIAQTTIQDGLKELKA